MYKNNQEFIDDFSSFYFHGLMKDLKKIPR